MAMHHFQSSARNDPGWLPPRSRRRAAPRRGNTIVLVVGILVLLMIIATAYISRTHAGRVTAAASKGATLRDGNAQVIADSIASEIAEALFVRPLASFLGAPGQTAPVDAPRLPQIPLDTDGDTIVDWFPIRYGADPNNPYNFAPYQVVPFTNWPDDLTGLPGQVPWPKGPGAPNGQDLLALLRIGEGNPLGNPGFADARWLADLEPVRVLLPGPDGVPGTADDVVAFSHWPHMTNIARPDNAWRICRDISDITDADDNGIGGLVTDLGVPVEQFLPLRSNLVGSARLPSFEASVLTPGPPFFERWENWLSATWFFGGYSAAYLDPALIPPNFLDLKDLDGNGVRHDWIDPSGIPHDRPESEFIPGTARHTVGRVLADADGDGFTDSFWFLAPTMIEGGIRQIVAIRIIDNSAMLNANVATRFVLDDIAFGANSKTRGATPADLALVGQNNTDPFALPIDTWNVGFFDQHANWEGNPPPPDGDGSIFFPGFTGLADADDSPYGDSIVRYRDARWNNDGERDFLSEIGVDGNPMFIANAELERAGGRLDYWRMSGLRPFSATGGLTPFTLADELELRMSYGNNYPWILSRFERVVNTNSSLNAFLRSSTAREESSEYLDQLSNPELLFDSRRKLTLFNGARNDLMPPWLWWRWDLPAGILPGSPEEANFLAQARTKLDLREPDLSLGTVPPPGVLTFRQRLAPTLLLALTDGFGDPTLPTHQGQSYFGDYNTSATTSDSAFGRLRRLAAGWSANILAYRDLDPPGVNPAPLAEAVPLPEVDGVLQDDTTKFLGLERQPFLLEAFIGHVYASKALPDPPPHDPPYTVLDGWPGNYVDQRSDQTTIVVVQLANPFDQPIDLSQYKLRVFGQKLDLSTIPGPLVLQPGTESDPATAIFYAIDESLGTGVGPVAGFRTKWMDFLDIEVGDHPNDTLIWNVNAAGAVWSTDRADYGPSFGPQPGSTGNAIELMRVDNSLGVLHEVVIDRFDYDEDDPNHDEFRNAVAALPLPPPGELAEWSTQPGDSLKPGIRIGADDQWVTWARVTRAWGYDVDDSGAITADEKAPRYIFARQRTTTPKTPYRGDRNLPDPNEYDGDSYVFGTAPDTPWFGAPYQDAGGTPQPSRKPTFFDMNRARDPAFPRWSYPDKGFYRFGDALQMLQKDGDFEQVGELLNVWLFGHELEFSGTGDYEQTTRTFSEFMSKGSLAGSGTRVNRLRPGQIIGDSQFETTDPRYLSDPLHAVPALPAGLRVLDAFVCDDRGVNGVANQDEFRNANGFSGKMTPGLININTAPVEVMRALPHMTRLVHEDAPPADNPYIRVPEAIVHYRERFNGLPPANQNTTGIPNGADYSDRAGVVADLRPQRGVASIGELMLLDENALASPGPLEPVENWRVDFAGLRPPSLGGPGASVQSTRISTDVNDVFNPTSGILEPDEVAEDVEERNLLFAGISNLIATRSDMFTVHFKVRSFRQNPVTGVWDATDPEYIVDDSRYVMLVDRSAVNRPADKPKILYLEKLPK